jgi:hypothetical protein
MTSIVEIAGVAPTVKVDNRDVAVYGVSGRGFAALMSRFPEIGKLMNGIEIATDDIIKIAPDALAAVIAAGVGSLGDTEVEAWADKLSAGVQLDLVEAIVKQTFPRGVGPFAAQLRALGLVAQPGEAGAQTPASPATQEGSGPAAT